MIIVWGSLENVALLFSIMVFFLGVVCYLTGRQLGLNQKKELQEQEESIKKEEEKEKNNEGRQENDETFIDNGWLGGDEHKEDNDGDNEKGETK